MTNEQYDECLELADELSISPALANDMYMLAGNDADIVRKCSKNSVMLESMKCKIIDARFTKLEDAIEERGRENGCKGKR